MEKLDTRAVRRLALVRAGLLKPEWSSLPGRATGRGRRARSAAHRILGHFGYLQLDTVSVAGARSHALVLLSRIEGFDPGLAEELLRPGEPLFEYWGHEASWLPIELYPVFEFRRRACRHHPWWGDIVGENPKVADELRRRIRDEGPLRSLDMEGRGSRGWWDLKVAKKVATALWSSGELAIRERRNFQRSFDLAERVIPERWRTNPVRESEAIERLLLIALRGHGWATTGTLARTWRLQNRRSQIQGALNRLLERGEIAPCGLHGPGEFRQTGWIRPEDLEVADAVRRIRPRKDRGVLLSPFDPLLWDRERVRKLFGFHQILEIFKPAAQRQYGYFCLPVLAGERLVARCDLKAERRSRCLEVPATHFEELSGERAARAEDVEAVRCAVARYSSSLQLPLAAP